MSLRLNVDPEEYTARVERVRRQLEARRLDALVTFAPVDIYYLAGFFHIATERPIVLVTPREGEPAMLVPHLEQEHVAGAPLRVTPWVYPEYPDGGSGKHPMQHLVEGLKGLGLASGKRLGVDHDGYETRMGYRGPRLSALLDGSEIVDASDLVTTLRRVKSPAEIALLQESARWGNLAHALMQERIELGKSEIEISMRAQADAAAMMLRALGPRYQQRGFGFGGPVFVTFKAGANTALPHGMSRARGIQRGDVLVTYAGAEIGGYWAELERTMLVGEPTDEFVRAFEAMVAAQEVGFGAIRPGRRCRDVEAEVSGFIRDAGWGEAMRHHTGHGIGLEIHEQPFLDLGDDTVIEPGMVFSVEPGLYVPGLAGFRHSDTVVVTETGCERITYYPRDLASLTILV